MREMLIIMMIWCRNIHLISFIFRNTKHGEYTHTHTKINIIKKMAVSSETLLAQKENIRKVLIQTETEVEIQDRGIRN